LVQLSEEHAKVAADMTARYGIASVVRAIEVLGEALLDIRRAPDPRLVLEVTLVRLASNVVANDTASLLTRVERLETGGVASRPKDTTGPIPRPRLTASPPTVSRSATPATKPAEKTSTSSTTTPAAPVDDLVAAWPSVVRSLKATVRALYSAVDVIGLEGDTLIVNAPSDMHKKKCIELKDHVSTALTATAGRPINLDVRVHTARPTTAATQNSRAVRDTSSEPDEVVEDSGTDAPVESVVDQIAKSFPGARIVDSSKN